MDQEGRPTASRERPWAFFELFALVGFVVAQPTLDVLGKAPDFFLFRQAGRAEILLLVLAVTVLPALGLWLVEVAAGLAGDRARRAVHLLMVTGLLAVLALEVGKNLTSVRGPGLIVIGVVGGLAGGLLYANWPGLKLWLRYLAPAPLVFALVFLLVSRRPSTFCTCCSPTSPGTTCPTGAGTPTGATAATATAGPPSPGRPSCRASAT